jgi:type IV pilus assembly protein PilA
MNYARSVRQWRLCGFAQSLAIMTVILLLAAVAGAQSAKGQQQPLSPEDFKKYSGMLGELGQFFQRIRSTVQYPAPRNQSRLLPLLPDSTVLYAGLPNYGEVSHQALAVFRQEVKENAKLRAWWERGEMTTEGPEIEDAIEKFYELSEYLGDEIVVSAASTGKADPKFVLLAEARKPGLKDFLPKILQDFHGRSMPAVRVLEVGELANAIDDHSSNEPVILVRPDFIVLAENLDTLRGFNGRLEQNAQSFASTEFGRRLAQAYDGGSTFVAGLDLETILKKEGPQNDQSRAMFERTGFSDMKYLVWDHKCVNGHEISQFELSFTGSRRGVASWLAAPGPMGSLDFFSPNATIAASILLKDPQKLFDDAIDLTTASNPNALASLAQMEQGLKLSLRDDFFARLGGEIALELDSLPPQDPVWKVLLKARDPRGLLATLNTLFAAFKIMPTELDEDGITYYRLQVPTRQKTLEIGYAVMDGYLIVASSHAGLAEAIRLHRSGESLAKSGKLAGSLPPGNSADVSALVYEDPRAMAALSLRNISPELANSLLQSTAENQPAVIAIYGEETMLREASRSSGVDIGGAMVVAAIAIPNLLRARMAANESSAVSNIRTLNTGQVAYAGTYPQRGYAHDLASLGPNSNPPISPSSQHAGLIDSALGNESCTAGSWCIKSGYRFTITTACKLQKCREYVVVATPVNTSTGTRNFCSTSDAVVRFQLGPPLNSPIRAADCRNWAPLQ